MTSIVTIKQIGIDTYIKVHVHRLSMANVEVTIGLRRESGANNGTVDRCMLSNELLRVHSRRQLSRNQTITTRASFSVVSVSHCYVLVLDKQNAEGTPSAKILKQVLNDSQQSHRQSLKMVSTLTLSVDKA